MPSNLPTPDDRFKDWGDYRPSDLDDTPPGDPTDGFEEVDYSLRAPKAIPPEKSRDHFPHKRIEDQPPEEPDMWSGMIIGYGNDRNQPLHREYEVLRSDNRIVFATERDNTWENYFDIGDQIVIERWQRGWEGAGLTSEYVIVGKGNTQEINVVDYGMTANQVIPPNQWVRLDLTDQHTKLPIDDEFHDAGEDHDKIKVNAAQFRLDNDSHGLFEITVHVNVRFDNPTSTHKIGFKLGCWEPGDYEQKDNEDDPLVVGGLVFNAQQFRLAYGDDKCTANVHFNMPLPDMVLNQQAVGESAHWTQTAKLGGHLHLGTQVGGLGWLKIGTEKQYTWITRGTGKHKYKFPNTNAPYNWSFFVAEAVQGECHQMGWIPPGATGDVEFLQSNGTVSVIACGDYIEIYGYQVPVYDCVTLIKPKSSTLTFDRGLVISGPDLERELVTGGTSCQDPIAWKYNPCDEEFDQESA